MRHGIPEELCTDHMPFNSVEFCKFATDWNFTLTTSSPTYPQSNGQAERAVQTVKRIFTKAALESIDPYIDPYIVLLEYRSIPISGCTYSPAQMLMSRQLREKLPMPARLLKLTVVNAHAQLFHRQQLNKCPFDKGAKDLPPLQPGDSVRVRRGTRWEPATVVKADSKPRSYIVSTNGAQLRRNRRHLMQTPGVPPPPCNL